MIILCKTVMTELSAVLISRTKAEFVADISSTVSDLRPLDRLSLSKDTLLHDINGILQSPQFNSLATNVYVA